jgi:hypothetical protein
MTVRTVTRALRARCAVTCLSVVTLACASGAGGTGTRTNSNTIDSAQIEDMRRAGVRDLYELVDRLRPRWLQIRSDRSLQLETIILVYHHDTRLGGVETLRGYPLTGITSIRYLDAAQAGLLPGAGSVHVEGAIVINTATGRDLSPSYQHQGGHP